MLGAVNSTAWLDQAWTLPKGVHTTGAERARQGQRGILACQLLLLLLLPHDAYGSPVRRTLITTSLHCVCH